MQNTPDHQELINKKNTLLTRIEDIKRDLGRGLDADLGEQAIQLENLEVLQELLRVSSEELAEVNSQIEKFELERKIQ